MKEIKKNKTAVKIMNIVLAGVLPAGTLCFVEYFTHVPSDLTLPIFLTNLIFYEIVYLLCAFLTGRFRIGYVIATLLFAFCGVVNYLVLNFRSAPVMPWDIYSIRTAVSVAGNYKFSPDSHFYGAAAGLAVMALLGSRIKLQISRKKIRAAGVITGLCMTVFYTKGVGSSAVIDYVGLDTTLFTPKVLYRNNGLVTGFLGVVKYIKVEKPNGYSEESVREIIDSVESDSSYTENEELPNVIVIMNEAFSDPAVYGDVHTDSDYMPYIHSLADNTIKGNCYVSIKGGNTANSEYEFLTGNSMAFVPAGSVPYQQYIKDEIPSMARSLKALGYKTAAIHPYNASGWKRNTVYPLMGFEEQYFKSDFLSPDTLRGYISDQAAFEKIVELYEQKEAGQPLFAFEVTMQNHGGYSKEYDDLSEEIHLLDVTSENTQTRAAEKYLTLLERTDRAFKYLTEYFAAQDEKTIILMFGDHQPSDYITNTFIRLQGKDPSDSEVVEQGYIVPYIVWANYELPDMEEKDMSLNYLQGMLLEAGQIPMSSYQSYLSDLQSRIPILTARGTFDEEGNETEPAKEDMDTYRQLAYHLLCDTNKFWNFFTPKKE